MGYATDFTLTIVEDPDRELQDAANVIDLLERVTEYNTWEDEFDGYQLLSSKWYDHENHMKQLAKSYPKVLFRLRGKGEEQGDIWQMFFRGDLSYTWKPSPVEFPEFDASLLE